MKKLVAEGFGTAMLVLIGCGSVVISGYPGTPAGYLQIAIAFGLAVTAMAYLIGPISGCHINPAVSVAMAANGRMSWNEAFGYMIAQVLGGILGAGALYLIASGKLAGYDLAKSGLGANGFGKGYLGEFGLYSAIAVEFIGTFIFTGVILATTSKNGAGKLAGLIIGLTLLLVHLLFIPVTGVSVNPARSIGPALLAQSTALSQLWVFIVVPLVAAFIAGKVFCVKCYE
jgi:aquaporin Z